MGRKRKRKNKHYQQRPEQYPKSAAAVSTASKQQVTVEARPPKRKWVGTLLVATAATLLAAAIGAATRIFEPKLSITALPAVVNQMGVVVTPNGARHLVDVYFCVTNHGVRSGSVSTLTVNAVGLSKIPPVQVQDVDRAPIGAFSKRTVSAKLLVDDAMTTPEKTQMKLDVLDDADQWIGAFEITVARPFKSKTMPDGSSSQSLSVTISPRMLDACKPADPES